MTIKNYQNTLKALNVLVLAFALTACQTPSTITDGASKTFTMVDANETIGSIEIYDDRAYQFIGKKR